MKTIDKIKSPIINEMKLFEDKFYASMKTKVSLLDRIMQYIVRRKGKQMRPIFVFLSAKLIAEDVTEKTYRAASVIELIHTASLVHDDIVDDSHKRRGFFSINAIWRNKISVLVGDFLLSKSMLVAIENSDYDLLHIISKAIRKMSEGELLQIEKARRLDITEAVYLKIIEQKTAALIASCCYAGTKSISTDEEICKKMYQFGLNVGMAFQIKDDLFDYTNSTEIGKPTGIDIKEQKLTLPLIHCLENVDKDKNRWIRSVVKNHNHDKQKVAALIELVKDNGSLEYAIQKMKEYQSQAIEILNQFNASPAKESLKILVDYVIERKL